LTLVTAIHARVVGAHWPKRYSAWAIYAGGVADSFAHALYLYVVSAHLYDITGLPKTASVLLSEK